MRSTFVHQLLEYAKINSNIILVTGDLGYSVLERFQQELPAQFINAGIAEQNMTGFAAGLSLNNKIVFTYSIANFPTLRCLEQIRNDICYHHLNVKIVSVGSGFSYGTQGYTHHGIEDLAALRALPNMQIFSPACPEEVKWSIEKMMQYNGPCYLRLAKQGEPSLHPTQINFNATGVFPLITGYKNTILATGSIVGAIYNWIKKSNLELNLISTPVIKPFNKDFLEPFLENATYVCTVEEHQLNGGFGSAVLENVNDLFVSKQMAFFPYIYRLGINDEIIPDMTSEKYAEMMIQKLNSIYLNHLT
jgi:transketolase